MSKPSVEIRKTAMDLLARREHSVKELHDKLARRFDDSRQIEQEVNRLRDEGLQSDTRYAGAYLRMRAARGYGPLRIRQEMLQRGLGESDFDQACRENEINWLDNLQAVVERKYGVEPPQDIKDKAKRARFLQYRGFSHEHIRDILD